MSQCEICGERLPLSVEGYTNHYKRFHSVQRHIIEAPKIRPIRTTHRTKLQIIHDVEKTWGFSLFPPVMPWKAVGDR